ncbi:GNAT family N-acetyltransferase [Mariniluteicoccus flavus]
MTLEHRTFTATTTDRDANAEAVDWLRVVHQGFVGPDLSDKVIQHALDEAVADAWRMRGVYDTESPAYAAPGPVATFVTFDKTLNVGGYAPIDVTCITDVTVQATHRRRGLLRAMMTDELDAARERGHAVAALTVTEGTIYGRFGFGPTTFAQAVEVHTSHGFGLRTRPGGRVVAVERDTASRLGAELFERVHAAQFGSIGRSAGYADRVSGVFDHESGEADRTLRNAFHSSDSGDIDGWVAYAPAKEGRETLRVRELLALTDEAHLALWAHVASIDLSEKVVWRDAPLDDVLPWALADPRGYRVTARKDALWLRVLDPVAVLQSRGYAGESGRLVLAVDDPLGHAGGTWEVEVDAGRAQARATDREPDLACGAEELAPLILGGVEPRVLAAAGRLRGTSDALDRAHAVFGALGRPWTTTHF